MSDHVLSQVPFLPSTAPKASVLDYSAKLTQEDLSAIKSQIAGLKYKAKVVVLPENFGTPDFPQLAQELAHKWQVGGTRFLLVVDTKDHQVRGEAGNQLVAAGITGSRVSDILKTEFAPYARQGDLMSAITHCLSAVDQSLPERLTATASASGKPAAYSLPGSGLAEHPAAGWVVQLAILLSIGLAMFAVVYKRQSGKNKQLLDKLNERLNELYQKADEIGQASEYLTPGAQPELAQRVAGFFNQMTVLDKAKLEVEQTQKGKDVFKAGDGLLKCLRLAEALMPEASSLMDSVNASTGGTRLIQPPESQPATIEAESQPLSVPIPESDRYKRPAWSYQPAYAPPPVILSPGGGMMSLVLLLNQMEMSQRLDQVAFLQQQQPGNPGFFSDGGAGWSDSQNASDSGWGDSAGGGFADGGADWSGGGGSGGGGADW